MKQNVRDVFVEFSTALEGCVPWMYIDVKGLVTVAIGNLIDTPDSAMALPFVHKSTGAYASRAEIMTEWHRVKADLKPDGTKLGADHGGHLMLEARTELRLKPLDIEKLVLRKLDTNHEILESRFPQIDSWPADAQLATHSMAWACGPAFDDANRRGGFPLLGAILRAGDLGAAATQCHMNETNNAGLVPRNAINKALYRVAGLGPENSELVSWDVIVKAAPGHFRPRPHQASVVTLEQSMKEAEIVHPRPDLPERE